MKNNNILEAFLAVFLLTLSIASAVELTPESDAAFDERMAWFNDAQFGLFIHFGVYSTLGGEWKGETVQKYAEWIQRWGDITPEEYIPLAANFNPVNFDADLWVKTAKEAGMKYMVITTKHHEGFCLWDSAYTEYDIGEATVFNRDILGELSTACKKYGLKFGTYYSIIDWHHPTQRAAAARATTPMTDKAEYVIYMKNQLRELIENYHPAVMWFDGDWAKWWTMEDGIDLYNYLRELDPELVINNRVAKRKLFKKDFGTPEQHTPGAGLDHFWEACWTINHTWGYKKSDHKWKSPDLLIQKQIEINSKGGNLLLNVGPMPDGTWQAEATERLQVMGAWNAAHKDAVYGAETVDIPPPKWGCVTQAKGSDQTEGDLFVYVFDWPKNGTLRLEGISPKEVDVTTYTGQAVEAGVDQAGIRIDVSSVEPTPAATVLRIRYSGGLNLKTSSGTPALTGDEMVLNAPSATLSGPTIQLEKGHIGFWTDDQAQASWEFEQVAPEKYTVQLLYACDAKYAGSDVRVTIGGQTLTAKVPPTSSWSDYQLLDIGTVELNEVGRNACVIGFGEHKGRALFNLKQVILIPVESTESAD